MPELHQASPSLKFKGKFPTLQATEEGMSQLAE